MSSRDSKIEDYTMMPPDQLIGGAEKILSDNPAFPKAVELSSTAQEKKNFSEGIFDEESPTRKAASTALNKTADFFRKAGDFIGEHKKEIIISVIGVAVIAGIAWGATKLIKKIHKWKEENLDGLKKDLFWKVLGVAGLGLSGGAGVAVSKYLGLEFDDFKALATSGNIDEIKDKLVKKLIEDKGKGLLGLVNEEQFESIKDTLLKGTDVDFEGLKEGKIGEQLGELKDGVLAEATEKFGDLKDRVTGTEGDKEGNESKENEDAENEKVPEGYTTPKLAVATIDNASHHFLQGVIQWTKEHPISTTALLSVPAVRIILGNVLKISAKTAAGGVKGAFSTMRLLAPKNSVMATVDLAVIAIMYQLFTSDKFVNARIPTEPETFATWVEDQEHIPQDQKELLIAHAGVATMFLNGDMPMEAIVKKKSSEAVNTLWSYAKETLDKEPEEKVRVANLRGLSHLVFELGDGRSRNERKKLEPLIEFIREKMGEIQNGSYNISPVLFEEICDRVQKATADFDPHPGFTFDIDDGLLVYKFITTENKIKTVRLGIDPELDLDDQAEKAESFYTERSLGWSHLIEVAGGNFIEGATETLETLVQANPIIVKDGIAHIYKGATAILRVPLGLLSAKVFNHNIDKEMFIAECLDDAGHAIGGLFILGSTADILATGKGVLLQTLKGSPAGVGKELLKGVGRAPARIVKSVGAPFTWPWKAIQTGFRWKKKVQSVVNETRGFLNYGRKFIARNRLPNNILDALEDRAQLRLAKAHILSHQARFRWQNLPMDEFKNVLDTLAPNFSNRWNRLRLENIDDILGEIDSDITKLNKTLGNVPKQPKSSRSAKSGKGKGKPSPGKPKAPPPPDIANPAVATATATTQPPTNRPAPNSTPAPTSQNSPSMSRRAREAMRQFDDMDDAFFKQLERHVAGLDMDQVRSSLIKDYNMQPTQADKVIRKLRADKRGLSVLGRMLPIVGYGGVAYSAYIMHTAVDKEQAMAQNAAYWWSAAGGAGVTQAIGKGIVAPHLAKTKAGKMRALRRTDILSMVVALGVVFGGEYVGVPKLEAAILKHIPDFDTGVFEPALNNELVDVMVSAEVLAAAGFAIALKKAISKSLLKLVGKKAAGKLIAGGAGVIGAPKTGGTSLFITAASGVMLVKDGWDVWNIVQKGQFLSEEFGERNTPDAINRVRIVNHPEYSEETAIGDANDILRSGGIMTPFEEQPPLVQFNLLAKLPGVSAEVYSDGKAKPATITFRNGTVSAYEVDDVEITEREMNVLVTWDRPENYGKPEIDYEVDPKEQQCKLEEKLRGIRTMAQWSKLEADFSKYPEQGIVELSRPEFLVEERDSITGMLRMEKRPGHKIYLKRDMNSTEQESWEIISHTQDDVTKSIEHEAQYEGEYGWGLYGSYGRPLAEPTNLGGDRKFDFIQAIAMANLINYQSELTVQSMGGDWSKMFSGWADTKRNFEVNKKGGIDLRTSALFGLKKNRFMEGKEIEFTEEEMEVIQQRTIEASQNGESYEHCKDWLTFYDKVLGLSREDIATTLNNYDDQYYWRTLMDLEDTDIAGTGAM